MRDTPGDATAAGLLTTVSAGAYARRRGLITADPDALTMLGGGVSNVVLAIESGDTRLVVKQALPRLRVAEEWLAKRERVLTEAAALRWAHGITPDAVPEVFDVDAEALAITIAGAPPEWRDWKTILLSGRVERATAARLGAILAAWHRTPDLPRAFDDVEAFTQLRVDPYYQTVMSRHPALAPAIARYVERMDATRRCLVHGDYSPKNVLVGERDLWVIDFEVAHRGDPAFDLAFMLNHLLLKAIHLPAHAGELERCAQAFWESYRTNGPDEHGTAPSYVLGHVGCLMLARVDGKSPAEYLRPDEQGTARRLGASLITAPPATLAEAWSRLQHEAPV